MTALRADVRAGLDDLRTNMRELSRRTDRFVIWVAGTQVGVFLAVIGVLVGALYR